MAGLGSIGLISKTGQYLATDFSAAPTGYDPTIEQLADQRRATELWVIQTIINMFDYMTATELPAGGRENSL